MPTDYPKIFDYDQSSSNFKGAETLARILIIVRLIKSRMVNCYNKSLYYLLLFLFTNQFKNLLFQVETISTT